MTEPTGSAMAMAYLPLLFGVALFILLVALAIVIGNRAPYLRGYLWGAVGAYLASGLLPIAVNLIAAATVFADPMAQPSSEQIDQLVLAGSVASAVAVLLQVGALALYFLAAIRVAREVEPGTQP